MAYKIDASGNYTRTVRCGHCYEIGHNKSACPKRKQDLQEQFDYYTKQIAEDDFEGDWHKNQAQRHLNNIERQLEKMANRGKNRKCGFCGEGGHTRRTCKSRNIAAENAMAQTIDLRKKAAQKMADAGFGPGCLVKAAIYGHDDPILAIITDIQLAKTLPRNQVKKNDYFSTIEAVHVRFVTPTKENWSDRLQETACVEIPIEYLNIDNLREDEWYFNPNTI